MSFELIGKLIVKEDTVSISQSFRKREFVIEVPNERNSDWNDFVKFQATQDKCDILDGFQLGNDVKVAFNIRGRKWEKDGKVNYFTNLEAWKIESAGGQGDTPPPPEYSSNDIPPETPEDDLPF